MLDTRVSGKKRDGEVGTAAEVLCFEFAGQKQTMHLTIYPALDAGGKSNS